MAMDFHAAAGREPRLWLNSGAITHEIAKDTSAVSGSLLIVPIYIRGMAGKSSGRPVTASRTLKRRSLEGLEIIQVETPQGIVIHCQAKVGDSRPVHRPPVPVQEQ